MLPEIATNNSSPKRSRWHNLCRPRKKLIAARSHPELDDWDGPNDPDNPRNFSILLKTFSTIAVTFLAFVSTFAGSLYSPAHEDVSLYFHVSTEVAILPLSLYNLGMALGPLIGAPLSETFGRKVVFLITAPLFAIFTLASGFSQSIESLIVCRFFAGAFASPAISNASATIVDYTPGKDRALSLSFYYSIPFFGAVLGPLLGGFIVESKSWRWTQWTVIFFTLAFYIPVLFTRETYKKTILSNRARKAGIKIQKPSMKDAARYFMTVLITRPIHMLLTEPIVLLVCLYNGFMFGLMYTFVVASPWVFEHYYGFGMKGQSLSFTSLMIGVLFGPLVTFFYDRLSHKGTAAPKTEDRLRLGMIASLILPAGLFAFGWTANFRIHWICPMVMQGLALHASLLIYASASLYMLDAYGPLYGASAAGAAMLSRYTLSAAFPLFSLQMYQRLGVGWATSILAFCTTGLAPIPWLFYRYGKEIRERSKYEMSA